MTRAMGARFLSLILPLLLAPALSGCGGNAPANPPLGQTALEAIDDKPGAPRDKLARAVDALFADDSVGETRAVLILHAGHISAERYAPGYSRETRFVGWSMSKCVTSVAVGLLAADGRLRLDETAPVTEWQRTGDPRGEVTLRQLMQMRSGLQHTEDGDPIYESGEVRMLFLDGRDDMAAWAEAQPLEAVPGRKFEYSSATSVILADLATRALTDSVDPAIRRAAMDEFLRTRLFEPLGIRKMVAEYDAAGTMIGSSLIHGRARDWARFGEFLRDGGSVKGAQLVPRAWIDFMTTPSPRNPGYGGQVWLNRPQSSGEEVLFPDRAPRSLFACLGHLGQYVIVSREQKLVVVRLGKTDAAKREVLRQRMGDIVALFPKT